MRMLKRKQETIESASIKKKKKKQEPGLKTPSVELQEILNSATYLIPNLWHIVKEYVHYNVFATTKTWTLSRIFQTNTQNMDYKYHITPKGTILLLSKPQQVMPFARSETKKLDELCKTIYAPSKEDQEADRQVFPLPFNQLPLLHWRFAYDKNIHNIYRENVHSENDDYVCLVRRTIRIRGDNGKCYPHPAAPSALNTKEQVCLYAQNRWLWVDHSKDLFPKWPHFHSKHGRVGFRMRDDTTTQEKKQEMPILFSPDPSDWNTCPQISTLDVAEPDRGVSHIQLGFRTFQSGKKAALIHVISSAKAMGFYNGYALNFSGPFDDRKNRIQLKIGSPAGDSSTSEFAVPEELLKHGLFARDIVEKIVIYPDFKRIIVIVSQDDSGNFRFLVYHADE